MCVCERERDRMCVSEKGRVCVYVCERETWRERECGWVHVDCFHGRSPTVSPSG